MGQKLFPQFPFGGGISEKTEAEYLDPSANQETVLNGIFTKAGAIDPRLGISYVSNTPKSTLFPAPAAGYSVISWNRGNLAMVAQTAYTGSGATAQAPAFYSQDPVAGNGTNPLGWMPTSVPERRPLNVPVGNSVPVIGDYPDGQQYYRVAVSLDINSNVLATVYEADTGNILVEPTIILAYFSGDPPLIINCIYIQNSPSGSQFLIILQDGGGRTASTVYCVSYYLSNNEFSNAIPFMTNVQNPIDAVPYIDDSSGNFIVAQVTNLGITGQAVITSLWTVTAGTPSQTASVTNLVDPADYTLQAPVFVQGIYGSLLAVVWQAVSGGLSNIFTIWYSADLALTFVADDREGPFDNAITLTGSCSLQSGSTLVMVTYNWDITGADGGIQDGGFGWTSVTGAWFLVQQSVGLVSSGNIPAGFQAINRPFTANNCPHQAYIFLDCIQGEQNSGSSLPQSLQVTAYLLGWQPATQDQEQYFDGPLPVATVAKNIVSGPGFVTTQENSLWHLNSMSSSHYAVTRFACGLSTVGLDNAAGLAGGSPYQGVQGPSWSMEFYFDQGHLQTVFQGEELGSELHISGGVPFVFDGQVQTEDNFFYYPEWAYAFPQGTTTLIAGTYQYAVNYAYTDAAGLIHRSAPAYIQNVVITAPEPPNPFTGTTDITQPGIFGISGSLNDAIVGFVDVTQSSIYGDGSNGTLNSPIVYGGVDITASGLYGAGGSLNGETIGLFVNGPSASGFEASIAWSTPVVTMTGLQFINSTFIGQTIQVTGAASPGNNGDFVITGTSGSNTVTYNNASGVNADANNGSIQWTIFNVTANTLTLNGSTTSHSMTNLFAAIQAQWPQLYCGVTQDNYLYISSTTTGPNASIVLQNATFSTANAHLGFPNAGIGGDTGLTSPPGGFTDNEIEGGDGRFFTSGGSYYFQDPVANNMTDLAYGRNASTLCANGDLVTGNRGLFVITAPVNSNTVQVTPWTGASNPSNSSSLVSWSAFNSCNNTRGLTMDVNGTGLKTLTIGANTVVPTNFNDLKASMQALWPNLSVELSSNNYMVLAVNSYTGGTWTIQIVADTANDILGLGTGTFTHTDKTLIMNVNAAGALTLTLNGNAGSNADNLADFLAAIEAEWPLITATTNSSGELVLTYNGVPPDPTGDLASVVLGAGTANTILGLTPGTSTGTNSDGYVIHIPALSATWRTTPVYAEVYRTQVNGSTLYLIDRVVVSGSVAITATNAAPEVIWPGPTTPDVTLDSSILTSTFVYTTGGVLPNINPPAFRFQITHNSRVVGVDETLQQVWLSQAFSVGTAPGWSGSLVIPFAQDGDITSIESMDGALYIFKNNSIWVMYGNNGPTLTGSGSDWTVPQRISSNVGAISGSGTVPTDVGIFFQSPFGIYLLGRNVAVTFIGQNVIDTLNDFPTITSSCLVPSQQHVRWVCTNGETSVTIVYDYLLGWWVTHTYPQILAPISSAILTYTYPQRFTMCDTTGLLWQENLPPNLGTNVWWDSDQDGDLHFVGSEVTTAWVKGAAPQAGPNLQAYLRCLAMQLYAQVPTGDNTCGLQIQLCIDYNPTPVQTENWSVDDLTNNYIPGQVLFYLGAEYNQAMAYQFILSSTTPAFSDESHGNGQGARFIGFGLQLETLGPKTPFLPVLAK